MYFLDLNKPDEREKLLDCFHYFREGVMRTELIKDTKNLT